MFIREIDIESFLKRNDIEQINSNDVKAVNMDNYGVSTEDKPALFTFGLATCRGLVATSKNFAFLAHIDMGFGQNGFETEYKQLPNGKWDTKVKRCNVTRDLYNSIYRNRDKITEPIEITVILGSFPVDENGIKSMLLERGINNTINMCAENLDITVNRLPNVSSTSVLVDSRSGKLILDKDLQRNEQEGNFDKSEAIKLQNTVEILQQMSAQIETMKSQVQELDISSDRKNSDIEDRQQ